MINSIYIRLAANNLKNNRKTYVPYILTAILTVMMYYIIDALSRNKSVGDGILSSVLSFATGIVIIFAVIFLFYTNSFLIKRRKKEIGVYNILGMEKRHIAKMLVIETVITAATSIVTGLVCGIIFSKLFYLVLLRLLHYDVGMGFEISVRPLLNTEVLFLIIFLLTLFYNMMQIKLANPIELLHGSSQGEKEPKTKILLTIAGVILTGIGYYIAVTTESPLAAIQLFFVAVICVILGTYALFVAGGIALLKLLRQNKKFYYTMKHFISVSGMIYRMKQNAVGLANICILSTMVLVMISSTISLYMGMDDILTYRFPTEFTVEVYGTNHDAEQKVNQIIEEETKKAGVEVERSSLLEYHEGKAFALQNEKGLELKTVGDYLAMGVCEVYMIPVADYNQLEKKNVTLNQDEVLVYTTGDDYGKDTIQIGTKTYQVVEELSTMRLEKKNNSRTIAGYFIIMSDENQIQELLAWAYQDSGMKEERITQMDSINYEKRFDLKGTKKARDDVMKAMQDQIQSEVSGGACESREMSKESFYMLYGGLLFIGMYLGVMFLMATVLIIYYKQISEGYDDKERYQLMKKVGMCKREVKRSIRSQVLTVFYLPLIVAVIHIAVAFKVITKLLATFNFVNVPLYLGCTVATVAVFAVFYAIVYSLTAREYYKIVN